MSYVVTAERGKTLEQTFSGKAYVSPITKKTECVAFVQEVLPRVPSTASWKEGKKITQGDGLVPAGTAIATFVDGKYPGPGKDKHAAIYLGQDPTGIQVLDQWASQGKVLKRTIRWNVPEGTRIQNDGTKYSVIE
jgi:hypothetical protein